MTHRYRGLAEAFAKADRRHTEYQFDLERDIAWARISEAGDYVSDSWLRNIGIDPQALAAHPEARELFQWAVAVNHCDTFMHTEDHLIDVIGLAGDELAPIRSVGLLVDEERKHIAMFQRYRAHLAAQRPDDAAWLAEHFRTKGPRLGDQVPPELEAGRHYLLWLMTLLFEEYTVYFHRQLDGAANIQPTWRDVHRLHAVEETQHLVTDAIAVAQVALNDADRLHWSRLFVSSLNFNVGEIFRCGSARALLDLRFPDLPLGKAQAFGQMPMFQEVLRGADFRRTQKATTAFFETAGAPLNRAKKPA